MGTSKWPLSFYPLKEIQNGMT